MVYRPCEGQSLDCHPVKKKPCHKQGNFCAWRPKDLPPLPDLLFPEELRKFAFYTFQRDGGYSRGTPDKSLKSQSSRIDSFVSNNREHTQKETSTVRDSLFSRLYQESDSNDLRDSAFGTLRRNIREKVHHSGHSLAQLFQQTHH